MEIHASFIILLTTAFLLNNSSCEDAFNKMIDGVLAKLENNLNNATGQFTVNLPDAMIPIKKNFLWFDLNGVVQLRKGKVLNMSGLKKIGNANLVMTNGGDTLITMSVSWSRLILHYDIFKYSFLILDMSDSLTTQVKNNAVSLNATFHYGQNDTCHMKLNSVDVTDFQDFTSTLAPHKWYKLFNDYIVNYVLGDQSPEIVRVLNNHLTQNIESIVSQMNLCQYLPY